MTVRESPSLSLGKEFLGKCNVNFNAVKSHTNLTVYVLTVTREFKQCIRLAGNYVNADFVIVFALYIVVASFSCSHVLSSQQNIVLFSLITLAVVGCKISFYTMQLTR